MEWNGIRCLDSRPLCLPVEQPWSPKATPWSGGNSLTFEHQNPGALDGILQQEYFPLCWQQYNASIGCNAGAYP
jgi:hypothetical protein